MEKLKIVPVNLDFLQQHYHPDFVWGLYDPDPTKWLPTWFIPKNEFWIGQPFLEEAEEILARELFLSNFRGRSFLEAVDQLNAQLPNPNQKPLSSDYRVRTEAREGVNVVHVRGKLIRREKDINFVQGGHHWQYDYVPENEIWVEDGLSQLSTRHTITHELHERVRMMPPRNMDYNEAHDRCLLEEKVDRRADGGCFPGDTGYDIDHPEFIRRCYILD